MIKSIRLLILILLTSSQLTSQSEKGIQSLDEARKYCEKITDNFSQGNLEEAFNIINTILILPENELSYIALESIKQFNMIEGRYGEKIGYSLPVEKGVENELHSIEYLVKFDYHAIRLEFKFYKGKDGLWFLNKFKWDDEIYEILKNK